MSCVVQVPVARHDAALLLHAGEQPRAGIRCLDVEGRRRNAVLDRPVHGPSKHIVVIVIHTEDEAAVDHDPQIVEPIRHGRVVTAQVLALVAADEIAGCEGLEPDEQAAKAGRRGPLDQIATEDRVDGRGPLKEPVHPAHAVKQRPAEALVAE